jgi:hypothetical protein
MPNATHLEDDLVSFADLDTFVPEAQPRTKPAYNGNDAFDALAAKLSAKQVTKRALLTEVKARSLTVIEEYDRSGYAYVYLRDTNGWYRFSARKLRRGSSDLQSMLWDAAKRGQDIAICTRKPSEVAA